ncbi:CIS tube protein [Celerinatantimonas yamalensis]|uniref:Peptidoglycan-binding protein n=1 Tax=Celerinatantimonas yamalensis TaxID=559956 RepID=A0ABW9G2I3_9GAMM
MIEKLKITAQDDKRSFTVMLNPNTLKHDLGINYTNNECKNRQAQGDIAPSMDYKAYQSEKLSFEILVDATGVVEQPKASKVDTQIDALKNVIYRYVGTQHQPSVVTLTWGNLSFKGRLTSMGVSYILFSSSGVALRAKINLAFEQYMDEEEKAKLAKKSSPDLTHVVTFKAGDTLPLLCAQIYHNAAYYMEVARVNRLASIRHIPIGTQLYFPPLV